MLPSVAKARVTGRTDVNILGHDSVRFCTNARLGVGGGRLMQCEQPLPSGVLKRRQRPRAR